MQIYQYLGTQWKLGSIVQLITRIDGLTRAATLRMNSRCITWRTSGQFWLKTLLQQGISEPIFYGDLVYKFKRIVGKPNFSDQFKKIVKRYIRVGYNLDIMRQSACLVLNPIMVYSYGFLFNCRTVGQASDSMMALT